MGERGVLARQGDLGAAVERLFPQLGGIEWAYHWGGYVALTTDHLPHLHELEPGIVTTLGCNGRGVAMATAMGQQLAAFVSGTEAEDLDFPVTGLVRGASGSAFELPNICAAGERFARAVSRASNRAHRSRQRAGFL